MGKPPFIFLVIYQSDKLKDHQGMSREETRRENARRLSSKIGGKAEFGRFVGMDPSQVSQLIGPNPTKNIGNSIARRIERAFDLPEGYLDVQQPQMLEGEGAPEEDLNTAFLPGARRVVVDSLLIDVIPIKKVALSLQAGVMGFEATQVADGDTTISIPRRFIEENDLVPQCLLAISIKGDSMYPLMIEDDIVVVNIADTKPISGELYAINFDGEAVVKQLVREGPEWYLVSTNPDPQYRRRVCRGAECIIVGRVVFQPGRKLIGRV